MLGLLSGDGATDPPGVADGPAPPGPGCSEVAGVPDGTAGGGGATDGECGAAVGVGTGGVRHAHSGLADQVVRRGATVVRRPTLVAGAAGLTASVAAAAPAPPGAFALAGTGAAGGVVRGVPASGTGPIASSSGSWPAPAGAGAATGDTGWRCSANTVVAAR